MIHPIQSRTILILTTLIALLLGGHSQVNAQSANVRKVAKSVFSLTTFKADGALLSPTHGVSIGENGEAISTWKSFMGADNAVVIDAQGKAMTVDVTIGANELCDTCRFKAAGNITPAKVAASTSETNEKVSVVDYSIKSLDIKQIPIQKVGTFMGKCAYYIFSSEAPANKEDCSFANAKGEVIGMLQYANSADETHTVDAEFMNDIKVNTGLSIADPVLRQTSIRTQVPSKESDVLVMLMISREQNHKNYLKYAQDLRRLFLQSVNGYVTQVNIFAGKGLLSQAVDEMETVIKRAKNKDVAHSEYAKLIYQQQLYQPDSIFTQWSLDKALDEATQANNINPLPVYQHQQAQIILTRGNYQKAYDMFMALMKTSLRSGELFYEAAQAKTQLKADKKEILTLLDSTVAACPQPLTPVVAPYVLARGVAYDQIGEYKKALADYNQHDTLMLGRASREFYYTRYKYNSQLRRYQQTLDDIAHAAVSNRQEPTYLAEMASLQSKVNLYKDIIKTADLYISLAPSYAGTYLIKGLAQVQNKQRKEGLETLNKAKELGDARAKDFIDKYK